MWGEGLVENVRIPSENWGRGSKIAQKKRHMIFGEGNAQTVRVPHMGKGGWSNRYITFIVTKKA